MSVDFERSRHQVCGRPVTITSWHDDKRGTWAAGAPNYAHVCFGDVAAPTGMPSRATAIAAMVRLLAQHFGPVND